MKRILGFLTVLITVSVFVSFFVGYSYYQRAIKPVNPAEKKENLFYVSPGTPFNHIAYNLKKDNYLRDVFFAKLYNLIKKKNRTIQPGYYQLSRSMNFEQIMEKLYSGKIYQIWLTIPEGYNIKKIVRLLDQKENFSGEKYLQKVGNPEKNFFQDFSFLPQNAKTLEGYLFPDTYDITGGTEKDLINLQLQRFSGTIYDSWQKRPGYWKYNLHQTLTLASIVELEAVKPEERTIIAGVFVNRLKQGIPLGSDPTVEYALGWHQGEKGLSYKDILIKSPYNTYLNAGLPPGPIANPGLASFQAVLDYADTPFLYFVARGDGSHVFTTNYQDHLAAQRKIRTGK